MKKRLAILICMMLLGVFLFNGCGRAEQKRIVRIGHNQSSNHPTHIALLAFRDYIHEYLGDKYVVEVYPSELLGSDTDRSD